MVSTGVVVTAVNARKAASKDESGRCMMIRRKQRINAGVEQLPLCKGSEIIKENGADRPLYDLDICIFQFKGD